MPDADIPLHPGLTRHLGFLINRAAIVARQAFLPQLEELGLHPRMWGILNVLDAEDGLTQGALGRMSGIDPSSMVAAIDDLERQGWVERRRNPADRRAYSVHVTDAGRAILTQGRRLAREAHERWLAPLSEEEREQLHRLLLRIVEAAASA